MAEAVKREYVDEERHVSNEAGSTDGAVKTQETYAYDESRKIGVTGAVFLILNKMIGTGSK